jgi:heme a synthase
MLLKCCGILYIGPMPFDVHDFPDATRMDRAATRKSRRLVAVWLFTVAAMIMVMIVLGGATRLTGSGLSIMEWAPLMGALPPATDAEWHRLFALYQKIPQYSLVNEGFGLDGFKQIFWLEWTHRLWGRLIGVIFLLPMLLLWATGRIEHRLLPRLGLLFVLGGLQGVVGWFMVASGFLPATTAVSPYRLVIHLVLALVLYAAIVWTGLSAVHPLRHRPLSNTSTNSGLLRILAIGSLIMVSLTIVAGGFTAGLHAGLTYRTFPLMDGHLVPDGYTTLDPLVRNLTENVAAVQFDHRLLATLTLILVSTLAANGWRAGLPRPLLACLVGAVLVQYALGVTTLLLAVPVPVAALHQCGAVILLTVTLIVVHHLSTQPRWQIETQPVLETTVP